MNKTALQNYCLQVMGITQWKTREASNTTQFPYLFCLPQTKQTLSVEEEQLLQRLKQALQWPEQQVMIHSLTENTAAALQSKVATIKPQKVVIFSQELAQQLGFKSAQSIIEITQPFSYSLAMVSSLEELLINKVAKKQTWQTLRSLIKC